MGKHFNCAELARLLRGTAPRELVSEFVKHHLDTCEACRKEHLLLIESTQPAKSWSEVFQLAMALAQKQSEHLDQLERVAQRDFRELMRMPAGARRHKINRALARFKSPVLVDLLLEESRKKLTSDPWAALALVECAQDAALRVSHQDFGQAWAMTSLARVHGYRGNALRVTGDFKQANEALLFGLRMFDEDGNGDPLIEAELMSFLASLRMDQRNFVEADGYLDMAQAIYVGIGETGLVGRILIQKAMVLFNAGEFDRALVAGLQTLKTIDREKDSKLYLSAEHNYTFFLQEVGRYREAWSRLQENHTLYESFPDSWTQLRRKKLEGNILRGLGRRSEAEVALIACRKGFIDEGLGFYAALAGLDLAYLYIEEGKSAEVARLAEEMVPIFMAQDIDREAAAALLLFQEAARQDALTTAMIKQLIAYMERVKIRPGGRPS